MKKRMIILMSLFISFLFSTLVSAQDPRLEEQKKEILNYCSGNSGDTYENRQQLQRTVAVYNNFSMPVTVQKITSHKCIPFSTGLYYEMQFFWTSQSEPHPENYIFQV
ncbi:MAG: hypothetical protein MI892_20420, partial [Desulfobacterales bacterium]|nr:hypothetical protein [Desulfobacterales bacterium]